MGLILFAAGFDMGACALTGYACVKVGADAERALS